jgi:hypothetical protein
MKQYDEVKCPICGVNWFEHSPECCRHAYRPVSPPRPDWVEETPSNVSRPDVGSGGAPAGHPIPGCAGRGGCR